MFKHILLYFLLAFSLQSNAFIGDSLKLKPVRHTIDCSAGFMAFVGYRDATYSPDYFNSADEISYRKSIVTFGANYGYRLNARRKKNLLFLNLGINYINFDVYQKIGTQGTRGHSGYDIYNYNNETLKYNIDILCFNLYLEHILLFNKLLIIQKIGISNSRFLHPDKLYYLDYTRTYSVLAQDPALVSQGNPGGYYFNSGVSYGTQSFKANFYENFYSPFYGLGLGLKLKNMMPFINTELSVFNWIESPVLKTQAGIKLLF